MEEYETKRQYLRHLKKIAEIREGMGKLPVCAQNLNLSRTKTRDFAGTKSGMLASQCSDLRHHTSTERIMRDFNVEKENTRLVTKILKMNSSIPLRKYQQDYEDSKKYLTNNEKNKKTKCLAFRFFDINFSNGVSSSPQDHYCIYMVDNLSKVMLAKGTLFQLRKKQLKFKKKEVTLKVEGKNQEGTIKITEQSLLDIRRHGQTIGHVVLQHLK